jgi:hypothetical protein
MLRLIWCLVLCGWAKWTLGVGTWVRVPRTFPRMAVRGGLKIGDSTAGSSSLVGWSSVTGGWSSLTGGWSSVTGEWS